MNDTPVSATHDDKALSAFVARIDTESGRERYSFAGTGFLVSPQYVVTCAHVALGGRAVDWLNPDWIELPHCPVLVRLEDELARCHRGVVVAVCKPDGALIRLEEPLSRRPVRFIANLTTRHEPAIIGCSLVVGFSDSAANELSVSRIRRIVDSLRAARTVQIS